MDKTINGLIWIDSLLLKQWTQAADSLLLKPATDFRSDRNKNFKNWSSHFTSLTFTNKKTQSEAFTLMRGRQVGSDSLVRGVKSDPFNTSCPEQLGYVIALDVFLPLILSQCE